MDGSPTLPRFTRRLRARLARPRIDAPRAAALLAGAVAVQAIVHPLPSWIALPVALVALLALFARGGDRVATWFVLGLAWTLVRADAVLEARLDDTHHGRDIVVEGRIDGLPEVVEGSTRFTFVVDRAEFDGTPLALAGNVRLNWYTNAPPLEPCTRWRLVTRLRPPRGLVNPGGHDAERGAALHGRVAVGYVRDAASNARLDAGAGFCVDRWRQRIVAAIDARQPEGAMRALLRALAVGDQSAIAEPDWQTLRATGIGHLIAISGLHVGMFAAFGAWLARRLWRLVPRVTLRLPAPLLEAPVAMACATGYGLLAGMGLPTLRTLLMIGIALLARYARRTTSVPQGLALAGTAIVAWDPLAVLSAGFWLSFAGVAILLAMTEPVGDERAAWRDMPRVQLLLSAALLPLTVWFFGQGSVVGPLANLVAVPWISFVVVPCTVAASLLLVVAPALGTPLLTLSAWLLEPLWWLMRAMGDWPSAQLYFATPSAWAFVLALVGIAWCLLPRGVPARALGLLLVLPMLWPARTPLAEGAFEAWMLDVGQGLAVIVRTRDHVLVYDAGPRYPSGFDTGEAVVVPSLRALGLVAPSRILISHGDSDHAGGARALALAYPDAVVASGEPERLAVPAQRCAAGDAWSWNGVRFRVIWPDPGAASTSNDRSCVLAIEGAYGTLLLTGDATARAEATFAARLDDAARPRVLAVGHHGSRTATSPALLNTFAPDAALIPVGHRNRFGHPHRDVIARLDARDIPVHATAAHGHLHLRFTGDGGPLVTHGRERHAAWWRMP
ncbi:DNA internalization-related competence protein ComEC/Rec2 [Dokdonella sp. MW10]|uniref:DNA internalization-related competence protein ComEC/Rec2 n=1 Tax=Dokdonella sp. MW10 TaxID=2992926 RepID=UPI003F7F1754